MRQHYLILAAILFAIFVMRFPSLFEPFWYGDEGIFAAVAANLNQGGILYQTAWDNKPPLIYLTYAPIFKFLGVSMFWLHLIAAIVVLATTTVIYGIAKIMTGPKRALIAALIFGFLTSLRIVEGNLALTEIFMILPASLAMLLAIRRNLDYFSLLVAGILLAIASLYKQVGALEAAALGVFLFLKLNNLGEFLKRGAFLGLGFLIPYLVTLAYFAQRNLLGEYIFAAYTYYQIYLGESPQYAILVSTLKFMPIGAAIVYGFYDKTKREVGTCHLILLWTAFAFLGSFFSGRTYGHYLVQAVPPVSLLLGSISFKPIIRRSQVAFALFFFIPLVFLIKIQFSNFLTGGPVNQINYWLNFADLALGKKGLNDYNNFFDRNVNDLMALSDFLATKKAVGGEVYIWGDYPWLYAIANLKNPSRYVTSFHVFGVPQGKEEVAASLENNQPDLIIKPPNSIGVFPELEQILTENYTMLSTIENSQVFAKRNL